MKLSNVKIRRKLYEEKMYYDIDDKYSDNIS